MFIKNDTALFRARRTVIALLWVMGILFVIAGIILCALHSCRNLRLSFVLKDG